MRPRNLIALVIVYVAFLLAMIGALAKGDELNSGEELHKQYCSSCHVPYPAWVFPVSFFEVKWKYMLQYITQFGATPEEVQAIKEYVEAERRRLGLPMPEGNGGVCPHTGEAPCQ
jgi:hypothetical protein